MAHNRALIRKTRKNARCPVFGMPQELPENVLPTYQSVMRYYVLVKQRLKWNNNNKDASVADIAQQVAVSVENIWLKSSIPLVSHKRVLNMIRSYHDKYMKLIKPLKGRQNDEKYRRKIFEFREEGSSKLFDIAACKCALDKCDCVKEHKVPVAEKPFLCDQRTCRLMYISTLDRATTNKLIKRNNRKSANAERSEKYRKMCYTENTNDNTDDTSSSCQLDNCNEQSDCEKFDDKITLDSMESVNTESTRKRKQGASRLPPILRRSLPTLARACDRHGLSDRSAASVASAVLQDFGLLTADDSSNVIDKSKVRRERKKARDQLRSKQQVQFVQCLSFDGRKDKTLVNIKQGSKYHHRIISEEHITLVLEPESTCRYLGHTSPRNGSAKEIQRGIMNYLSVINVSVDKLVAIGCDGTNVNVGQNNGVIRLMELEVRKPLQWLVCQLHGNELPLRHLFLHLDGSTTGPRAFSGPFRAQ